MTTFIRPCKTSRVSSSYARHKNRTPPSKFPGTDYACPTGEKVWASADGVVTRAGSTPLANGKNVRIAHPNGFTTYYLHLSRIDVAVGQHVKQGQVVGLSGNTGHSTGPHLHFSVTNEHGSIIDPDTVLNGSIDSPAVQSHRTIKLGSRGTEVRYLQKRLGILADGIFGLGTRRAVIKFQKSRGLVADGVVGPKTWKALG